MSTSSCEDTLCKVESVFAKTVDPAASTLLAAPCMILICLDSCEARPKGKQIEHIEPSLQLQNQESMFTNCIVLVNQPTGIYRIQNKWKAGFLRQKSRINAYQCRKVLRRLSIVESSSSKCKDGFTQNSWSFFFQDADGMPYSNNWVCSIHYWKVENACL